jgi:zinc protease
MNLARFTQPSSYNHSLPGPDDILRVILPNGIVILSRSNYNSPSIVVHGYLPAGSLHEPDDLLGLAGFTASALMRGTTWHDFKQIYDLLESSGASLHFGSGTHHVSFSGKALAEDLPMLLGLIAEALRQPIFPAEQVERLRAQLLTGLAIRAQDTAEMASLTFDKIVYDGHPYSRPEDGYPETISAITITDIQNYHTRHYGPRGLVVAVVGAVDPRAAVDQVSAVLGDWQNPAQSIPPSLPPLRPLAATQLKKVTIPRKSQADIVLGVAGPPRKIDSFLAASLGNHILGQFGMMGRIGEAVREKAGLAYYASSSLSGGLGPGPWDVSAGVDPENVEEAIALIIEEIRRFTRELVTPEELADSQSHYIGRLPLSMESNSGVASSLVNLERYDLGLDYYPRYPGLVSAVNREQVLEIARQYLDPDRLAIAVAGP